MRAPLPTAHSDNDAAESYVRLVLALGQHDTNFVDAYYGPPPWRLEVEQAKWDLPAINKRAAVLEVDLRRLPPVADGAPDAELIRLRRAYLVRQLGALRARVAMLQGRRFPFDEESRELYDAVAPHNDEASFQAAVDAIATTVPGDGDLAPRYAAFKQAFAIPPDRLDAVFKAAIAECRRRTLAHITLPAGESFTVAYVKDKPWSAYNWYQGNYQSRIEVNTDLPVFIDRAIDLACHEGYPGHHVYNALLEQHLVKDRGWQEFSVYPLFSPQSLIAEGTANYGIQVAFSDAERRAFERDTLFPLAGIDPGRVDEYYDVMALAKTLSYAGNEAARGYLDGRMDASRAADWLVRYALSTPAQAAQRVKFFDTYRSYVINYNLGEDLVKGYVERQAGDDPAKRWDVFAALISSPRLPSALTE
ncbi:MAG TPA: hypothetical protein VMW48_10515 [Vicinamibacterales bacterium]|nr:hypothetical protein [Vicinamibacterales bacterium]